MQQALSTALTAVAAGVVLGTNLATAAECGLVLQLSDSADSIGPSVAGVAVTTERLASTATAGPVSMQAGNTLVPKIDSPCGTRLSASVLDDRLTLDVAHGQDQPTLASLTADLAPAGGPLTWSVETAFMADPDGADGGLRRFFGARNRIGLFDERLQASADVGFSLDAASQPEGYATRYAFAADLWRGDGLTISGTAGFALASAGYADAAVDIAADRAVREFGASLDWGRLGVDVGHSASTDNTGGGADQPTRRWRAWTTDLGVDLAGLHGLLPHRVDIALARQHAGYAGTAGLEPDEELDVFSQSLTVRMNWVHHGGTTTLGLSGSDLDDRADADGDRSAYRVSLERGLAIGTWTIAAAAALSAESVMEDDERQRFRSAGLALDMTSDRLSHGVLGLNAGLSLVNRAGDGSVSLSAAAARLTYDLHF